MTTSTARGGGRLNLDAESGTDPGPSTRRKRTFTVGGMMALVLGVAIGLAYLVAKDRAHRRVDASMRRASTLLDRVWRDNPGHPMRRTKIGWGEYHGFGAHRVNEYWMSSPTGSELKVIVDVRSGVFGDGPDLVTFESGGRSATRPLSEFDPNRPVNLAAILSGAGW